MEHSIGCARALSALVGLLRDKSALREDLRSALWACARASRHRAVTLERTDGRLTLDGTPSNLLVATLAALTERLDAHRMRRLVIRQFTPAAEILKLAQLLSASAELPAETRQLWHVEMSLH